MVANIITGRAIKDTIPSSSLIEHIGSMPHANMTNSSTSVDMPPNRRRFIGRLTTPILLIVLLVAGAWVERASLLRGMAAVWIVSDPVTSADVVAVLGGGLEVRRGGRIL
jgi:hypothetical protein